MAAKPESLHNEILEAIESNQLPIPSQPTVVSQLQEVVNDPDVTVTDLCDVIKQDPGLTARILRLANSPMIRGKFPIQGLENAVSRMGVAFVGNLAIGLALEQIFKTKNKAIAHQMNDAWEHSTMVACLCGAIGSKYAGIPMDQAMLAGLLHQIGILPILSFAEKHPEVMDDKEFFENLIEKYAYKLSHEILTAWQFSPELRSIPCKLHEYYEEKAKPDLADALLVSKLFALGDKKNALTNLDRHELPCFKRLKLDPDKHLEDYPEIMEAMGASRDAFH